MVRRTRSRPLAREVARGGDPAAFMARLFDLSGSVELAGVLHAIEAQPMEASFEPEALGIRHVEELVASGLAEARASVERAFIAALPPAPRSKLPSAAALLAGLNGVRSTHAALLEALWPPLGELLARGLDRVRGRLGQLRRDLGAPLRALGPRALRLEQLDAVLTRAAAKKTTPWFLSLTPLAKSAFERELSARLAALARAPALADLTAWYAPDGFLPERVAQLQRVLAAAVELEQRRIVALVVAVKTGR